MNITLVGFGTMGKAIAQTLQKQKTIRLSVIDRDILQFNKQKKQEFFLVDSDFSTISHADAVIIAVKPQDMAGLVDKISSKLLKKTLLISIAAGVSIKKLQDLFNHKKVVRMMPNLGLLVGAGIGAWKGSRDLQGVEKKKVVFILNQITENFEVANENKIDAITAISGSGPAYFFYLADQLLAAAEGLGLTKGQSKKLVEKTFTAAAALQHQGTYGELIQRIASKKGTTEAALKVFSKHHMDRIIKQAAMAAAIRAKELRNG